MAPHAGLSVLEHRPSIKVKFTLVNRDHCLDSHLQDVSFAPGRCNLVILSSPGQAAYDIQKAGEQLAAMQFAHHWGSEILAPNAARISLFFEDNLSGIRYSSAPPADYHGAGNIGSSERSESVGLDISSATHTAIQGMTHSG